MSIRLSTRARLLIALGIVAVVIGMLIRTAITRASTFYVTVTELYQEGTTAVGRPTTVSGNIVGSSVQWNPNQSELHFTVEDNPSGRQLPVVFHGPKPNDFSNDWPVIMSGTLNAKGEFVAKQLLVKCPSKYNAKPQTRSYKAS